MGLLRFHERTRDCMPHRKMYTSDDPTGQCTVLVEDVMTRLYRVGQDLDAKGLYWSLVRPWKQFFDRHADSLVPLIVVVVFDKEAYKPAMKRAVQAQRAAQSTTLPYTAGTYFDFDTQCIRDGDTLEPVAVEGPRIMRTPSLKRNLAQWLWKTIQQDIDQWPIQTCLILDFDDDLHILHKANYPHIDQLSFVEPIGEAEVNATRWVQRIRALPEPHSHDNVLVMTRDTDAALLLMLHITPPSTTHTKVRVYHNYEANGWLRVHVLRAMVDMIFSGRDDLYFALNVMSGCDFFFRGDVLHNVPEAVWWKVVAYSRDLHPLTCYADFQTLLRRVYCVTLKLQDVPTTGEPHQFRPHSWNTIATTIAKGKKFRTPSRLDQAYADVREVAVYWYTLQEHFENSECKVVQALLTIPCDPVPMTPVVETAVEESKQASPKRARDPSPLLLDPAPKRVSPGRGAATRSVLPRSRLLTERTEPVALSLPVDPPTTTEAIHHASGHLLKPPSQTARKAPPKAVPSVQWEVRVPQSKTVDAGLPPRPLLTGTVVAMSE